MFTAEITLSGDISLFNLRHELRDLAIRMKWLDDDCNGNHEIQLFCEDKQVLEDWLHSSGFEDTTADVLIEVDKLIS